jgi:hypothetical protein
MAAGDLCTLADAQRAAGIQGALATETQEILGGLITALSAYIPQVLNRSIAADNYAELYEGNGKSQILLRQRPIIQISSIAWRGQTITAQADPISGSSGFYSDGRNACLIGYEFPQGEQIRIIYAAGYIDIPADLAQACAELVAEAYARQKHVGESSRSQGGQITINYDMREMHAAIAGKLKAYRHGAPC